MNLMAIDGKSRPAIPPLNAHPAAEELARSSARTSGQQRRSRSLAGGVVWTVAGTFGFAACQWFMLVILAKLGRPEWVGQYALALGITAPVMLLANLNLRAVQSTDTHDDYSFLSYVQLRLSTTIVALLACIATAIVASFSVSTALVVALVACAKASESMSDVFYGRWQKWEQMDRIAKSMLIRGIGSLLAMTLVLWTTGSVVLGACGVFLSWLAVLVAYDMRMPGTRIHLGDPSWRFVGRSGFWRDLAPIASLAWIALPLGIVQMLMSLNANIPRFFIQAVSGERELGIYAAVAYVSVAGSTFVAAVGQAVSPRLAHSFANGDRVGFVRLLQQLAGFFSLCFLAAAATVLLGGKAILSTLYTPEYANDVTLLFLFTLCFGVGSMVSVCGFGITAARRFRAQVPVVVVAVVAVAIMSFILVPHYGVIGAAWAVLVSLMIWAVGSAWILRSVLTGLSAIASENTVPARGMPASHAGDLPLGA